MVHVDRDLGARAVQVGDALFRIRTDVRRHDHVVEPEQRRIGGQWLPLKDVQPGAPDSFNNYRFPSKLPEFFATGRPVILPRSNLGARLRHGVDAYVLDCADATGIAAAVRTLRADPALASRLAAGSARFARDHFSWDRSADSLAAFYENIPAPAA